MPRRLKQLSEGVFRLIKENRFLHLKRLFTGSSSNAILEAWSRVRNFSMAYIENVKSNYSNTFLK